MDKDNKRGFSGIFDLTSDTGALQQAQSRPTIPQTSFPQKTVFALLELTKCPTLLAPWSSVMLRDLGLERFLPHFPEEAEDCT